MNLATTRNAAVVGAALLLALNVGCGKPEPPPAARGKHIHTHDEWWCAEHGIPEEECSMCSKKLAKECKAKGDWCETHNRAKSHCFVCDPNLKEKYAAKYREKYGKEPPPVGEFESKAQPGKG